MSQPHRSEFRLLHRLRVRWAEIDLQRIVFNPHYLMYIDTAFTAYWRAMAMPYESIPALLGGDLYVKKSTLEYHGSAHLDDLLDIGVRCERVGNSSMGFRCGVFCGETLLVSGELVYVFADPAAQSARPIPQTLRAMLQDFEAGATMFDTAIGSGAELGAQAGALRQEVLGDALRMVDCANDAAQDAAAVHVLLRNRLGQALATGRLAQQGLAVCGDACIAWIAVTRSMRDSGLGSAVVQALVQQARARGDRRLTLRTTMGAKGFWERMGFVASGEAVLQAGLAHQTMVRSLTPA